MKMSGERVIEAPRARVWEALNDPEVLRQAIPGCTELVKHSPTEFSAKVMAKVGPVKANFAGDVTLSRLDPPNSYLISGKGSGGVAGFAEGGAEVRLEDADGQTKLVYDVEAKVGGKLAQIGSRLIDSTARRMADEFFARFADVVTSVEPQSLEPIAAAAVAPARKGAGRAKPGARKAAATKPARGTRGAGVKGGKSTAGPAMVQPPSHTEAAIAPAAATARPVQPDQSPAPATNIWWILIAGVAALLVIVLLANV